MGVLVVGRDEFDVVMPEGVDGPAGESGDGLGVGAPAVAVGLGGGDDAASWHAALDGVAHGFLVAKRSRVAREHQVKRNDAHTNAMSTVYSASKYRKRSAEEPPMLQNTSNKPRGTPVEP